MSLGSGAVETARDFAIRLTDQYLPLQSILEKETTMRDCARGMD